jgi:hypothetical protein
VAIWLLASVVESTCRPALLYKADLALAASLHGRDQARGYQQP